MATTPSRIPATLPDNSATSEEREPYQNRAPLRLNKRGLPIEKTAALGLAVVLVDFAKTDGALSDRKEQIVHRGLSLLLGYSALESALLLNSAKHLQLLPERVLTAEKTLLEIFSISQRRRISALCWEIFDAGQVSDGDDLRIATRLSSMLKKNAA